MLIHRIKFLIVFFAISCMMFASGGNPKPNVIFILTDDQGSGDMSCHGNPWLKTPNIDRLYDEAIRFTDYHVSPLCAPTRSALMTGRYPINNGVWATFKGRDAMSENAITLADLFKSGGYTTGLFGKWHLGDNYPSRPTDSGFDVVVQHKAGGVGELSDYWGNTYFDDTYYVNNEPKQFKGYCTDVWFKEAIRFIDKNKGKPFFAYIPTNAPHDPWRVDEKYAKPFRHLEGKEINNANFYGMLVNIDENLGKLNTYLKKNKLVDNTIFIYMTDNGSSGGISRDGRDIGYNHGLRGIKGTKTEGGHRVPFFIRWPKGKIKGGKDIDVLTAHVDFLPTLSSLCGLEIPEGMKLDGTDLSGLLLGKTNSIPERTVFVHHRQDWRPPMERDKTCILRNNWRLVNGKELYDIEKDRMQKNDLSSQYPEVKKMLLDQNAKFVATSKKNPEYTQMPVSIIGNDHQIEIKLTIQHAIGEGSGIWKAEQVAAGMKNANNKHAIEIEKDGMYAISCRRWPKECPGAMHGVPGRNPKNFYTYKAITPDKVRIEIANRVLEKNVEPKADEVLFTVHLNKGKTILTNDFIEGKDKYGVYYTYITYLGK